MISISFKKEEFSSLNKYTKTKASVMQGIASLHYRHHYIIPVFETLSVNDL